MQKSLEARLSHEEWIRVRRLTTVLLVSFKYLTECQQELREQHTQTNWARLVCIPLTQVEGLDFGCFAQSTSPERAFNNTPGLAI